MSEESLWLVGAGQMAYDYHAVLQHINKKHLVVGRGQGSANWFFEKTGTKVLEGGIDNVLRNNPAPDIALVAVGVEHLAEVTENLITNGVRFILTEKPGGVDEEEIKKLSGLAKFNNVNLFLGYNRRYYSSVELVRRKIIEDGGLCSVRFEFTEISEQIKELKKEKSVLQHWLMANSSHVIDLAFYLAGKPKEWSAWHKGTLDWHPASSQFCGAGLTENGVLFSYSSNWESPGRWALEMTTKKARYRLAPLEDLTCIDGSMKENVIERAEVDIKFKPGLYLQTQAFLNFDFSRLCSIEEQVVNAKLFSKIAGYP